MVSKLEFELMTVGEIMQYWPATIRVFLDQGMLCAGCPIAGFHTLDSAAREHGVNFAALEREITRAIRSEIEMT